MGASDINALINRIVKEESETTLPSAITTAAPFFANVKHLVYRVHSPVSLDVYDISGNHTGVATTTLSDGTVVSYVENNVPGTYYDQFGEVQYIFSDGSTAINIVLNGQGTGVATFDIEEMLGNTSVASTTFVNIAVEPQTIVSMSMSAGGTISGASNLEVDEDGDGEADAILPAGGTVMYEDFVVDAEEEPVTTSPQPQSGGGGGGGRNSPIVVIAIAMSTATNTPEATVAIAATSSSNIATTSIRAEQQIPVTKAVAAPVSQKQSTVTIQQDAAMNNVKLVAGVAASLPTLTASPTGEKWWVRIYRVFRGIIKSIIGL